DRAWWWRRQFSQWWAWLGGRGRARGLASRGLISGMVSGIFPGSGGGAWPGVTGAGAGVAVRSLSWAAVTAQIARAAMTSTMWRRFAVYSLAWHWFRPRQSLPGLKFSSTGP